MFMGAGRDQGRRLGLDSRMVVVSFRSRLASPASAVTGIVAPAIGRAAEVGAATVSAAALPGYPARLAVIGATLMAGAPSSFAGARTTNVSLSVSTFKVSSTSVERPHHAPHDRGTCFDGISRGCAGRPVMRDTADRDGVAASNRNGVMRSAGRRGLPLAGVRPLNTMPLGVPVVLCATARSHMAETMPVSEPMRQSAAAAPARHQPGRQEPSFTLEARHEPHDFNHADQRDQPRQRG